jgi:phosphotransferase system IIB component
MSKKTCKICGNVINIQEVKDQAKDDPIRTKNIKKDYFISRAFGYCITCLRAKKQDTNYLKEANKHQDILKRAFKNERQLRKALYKKGLTKEQINQELPKFKHLIK